MKYYLAKFDGDWFNVTEHEVEAYRELGYAVVEDKNPYRCETGIVSSEITDALKWYNENPILC